MSSAPKADVTEEFAKHFPEGKWNSEQKIPQQISAGTRIFARPLIDDQGKQIVHDLHSNPIHMEGYADGKPRTPERCEAIFNNHAKRWKESEFDSGFWFGLANEDGSVTPIGIGGIGTSGVAGIGELFFLLFKEQREIGHEAAIGEVLSKLTQFMIAAKTKVSGSPLTAVLATIDPSNAYKIDAVRQMGYVPATKKDMKKLEGTEGIFVVPKDSKVSYNGDMTVLDPSRHGNPKAVYFLNLDGQKEASEDTK